MSVRTVRYVCIQSQTKIEHGVKSPVDHSKQTDQQKVACLTGQRKLESTRSSSSSMPVGVCKVLLLHAAQSQRVVVWQLLTLRILSGLNAVLVILRMYFHSL